MRDDTETAEMLRRLKRSGWTIGSAAFETPEGVRWLVSGSKGENLVRAWAWTEAEAWRQAIDQARGVGMLAP